MGVDLYAEVLRHLATGIVIFNFEDKDLGRKKINCALGALEEFGGLRLKEFYQRRLEKFFKKLISVSVALKQQIQRVFLFLREYT